LAKPSSSAVASYRSAMQTIRSYTPCGAHILTNFRTTGSLQLVAHRIGVLEGMAPYLRPSLLNPTLATLYGARKLLRSPAAHSECLAAQHACYIDSAGGPANHSVIHDLGMQFNRKQLEELPQLTETIDQPGLLLFRVGDSEPSVAAPPPGYGC